MKNPQQLDLFTDIETAQASLTEGEGVLHASEKETQTCTFRNRGRTNGAKRAGPYTVHVEYRFEEGSLWRSYPGIWNPRAYIEKCYKSTSGKAKVGQCQISKLPKT